jgi:signal transduction histidine kinase
MPVNADKQRAAQVLDNLVSNAVKFSRTQVSVLVSAGEMGAEVRVIDDGPGISPQERDRIFDVYYSLSKDGDQRSSGNGLGLAVARGLAVNMGGTISVESSTSSGTTMLFTLPIV